MNHTFKDEVILLPEHIGGKDILFIDHVNTKTRVIENQCKTKALEQDFSEGKIACDFSGNKRNLMAIWDNEQRTWRYMDASLLWKAVRNEPSTPTPDIIDHHSDLLKHLLQRVNSLEHDLSFRMDTQEKICFNYHKRDDDNIEKVHKCVLECTEDNKELKKEIEDLKKLQVTEVSKPKPTRGKK